MQHRLAKYVYLFMLIVIVAVISAAGYGFVQQQKQIVIDSARLDLATIADLKAEQIVAWRRERMIEATSLYFNSMVANRIKEHLNISGDSAVLKEIQFWMGHLRESAGYNK